MAERDADDEGPPKGFAFLYRYLTPHKKFIGQLAIGLLAASLIQLLFPFLTQSVVDVGIQRRDLNFIYLVLIAQLFLYLGSTAIELVRGWILLHLSTRINIALISDFFIKLMKLPIGYFDSKQTGDILQRINDHQRIEQLLTTSTLSVLFSLFNIVLFGAVLAWYSLLIFGVFLLGSVVYVGWVWLFMSRRRDLDFKRFAQMSAEQSKVIELVQGMQEIKLHNAERQKRWGWEEVQVKLFKVGMKGLEEFGRLVGAVRSVALLPGAEGYRVQIDLPDGLTTSFHRTLPFKPEMKGQVEVVTKDRSVLGRIFDKLRGAADR